MNPPADRPPVQPASSGPPETRETHVETDVSPLSPQEIGSASRSCLVILALAVVIVLLICVSWLARLLF